MIESALSAGSWSDILRRYVLPVLLTSIPAAGCSDLGTGSTYTDPAGITVLVNVASFFITNHTQESVHFFAIERQTANYTDWISNCDTANAIPPNASREVSYRDVLGFHTGCQILLFWWHCSQVVGAGAQPGPIRTVALQTPTKH